MSEIETIIKFDSIINLKNLYEKYIKCKECNNFIYNGKWCINCDYFYCNNCRTCKFCDLNKFKDLPSFIKNIMENNLTYKCPNKVNGCLSILKYKYIDYHLKTCKFITYNCKNPGCKKRYIKNTKHICNYEILYCKFCSKKIYRKDLEYHRFNCNMANSSNSNKSLNFNTDISQNEGSCFPEFPLLNCSKKHNKFIKCFSNQIDNFYKFETLNKEYLEIFNLLNKKINLNNYIFYNVCLYCKKFQCKSNTYKCLSCFSTICLDCKINKELICQDCLTPTCDYCINEEYNLCKNCIIDIE